MKLELESLAAYMPIEAQNWLDVSFWQVGKGALRLYVACLIIRLLLDFTKSDLLGDSRSRAMRKILWDTATSLAMLIFYVPFFLALDALVYSFAQLFYANPEFMAALKVKAKPLAWYNLFGLMKKPFTAILQLMTEGAASALLHRIRALFLLIHLSLGQLSIAVSILPGERSIMRYWLRSTITIICWIIPMAALDSIFLMMGMHGDSSIWIQVALFIMYWTIPSITSLFLNSTQSSAVSNSVTQMMGLAQVSAKISGKTGVNVAKAVDRKYSPVGAAAKSISKITRTMDPKQNNS